MTLRVATRGSRLARWQAEHVGSLLGGDVELVVVETAGDRRRDVPLAQVGGQGVFVKEVQAAVLDGRADVAVHSAKDLPSSSTTAGLIIAAVPERGDPRDALVGRALADLPPGGRVGTGSVRRRALMASLRPDLTFADLRGNVDTRLGKVEAGQYDAIVVAVAALVRLERTDAIAQHLDPGVFVPQVAQGALAVECRSDDERALSLVAGIDHAPSHRAVDAERAFLATFGGGCDLPVGAYAQLHEDGLALTGVVASGDGRVVLRETRRGADGPALGREVAEYLLDGAGARQLLGA